MSTMGCNEFIDQLDAWMEGERDPQARAHTRECRRCRNFAEELDAIQIAAPALSVADPEPPGHIWDALKAQLTEEGLIHDGSRGGTVYLPSWLDRIFVAIPRPALASAYMILLLALALGVAGPLRFRTAPTDNFPLSAELDSAEHSAMSSVRGSPSPVSTVLNHNLAIVDNYITLCEKSVREQPNNEIAREYLYQAYQQKADLLAQMTERGDAIQ